MIKLIDRGPLGFLPCRETTYAADVSGTKVGKSERTRGIDPQGAQEIEERSPVLLQQESSFDSIGRPLFLGQAYYRADSYRFRSTLWRKPASSPGPRSDS